MNLTYIPASEIIREVKNELGSYFEKGALDESFLYPPIRTSLSKMGIRVLPLKKDVVRVENFKAELPCDFYKMVFSVACGAEEWADIDYLNTKLEEYYVDASGVNVCTSRCDYCEDSCGNMYGIRQYFNTYSVTYNELYPLKVTSGARPYCTEDCFKYQQKGNEITINNGHIYTGFERGTIYLEYLTNLDEDGELMIPDNEIIKAWIKDEMFYACFRKLWRNGEGDMERRYQDAKQQLAISQVNASNLYKRFTTKEYYDLRKSMYSRFHKYNTAVYGKYYNSNLSQYKQRTPFQPYVYERFV